jgi:hypothetical protein
MQTDRQLTMSDSRDTQETETREETPEHNSVGNFSRLEYMEDASVSEALYDFDQGESSSISFVLSQTERVQCSQHMLTALGLILARWQLIHGTLRHCMMKELQCLNKHGFGGRISYHDMIESISLSLTV